MIRLDDIDRRILAALQADARISNAELAERAGLSPSPCLRRVRAMEEAGVIKRYATLLEPAALGLPISVFVQVSLERQVEHALDAFEKGDAGPARGDGMLPDDRRRGLPAARGGLGLTAYERFLKDHLTRVPDIASIKSSFALTRSSTRPPCRSARSPPPRRKPGAGQNGATADGRTR